LASSEFNSVATSVNGGSRFHLGYVWLFAFQVSCLENDFCFGDKTDLSATPVEGVLSAGVVVVEERKVCTDVLDATDGTCFFFLGLVLMRFTSAIC
jgi:hypothetical protein